jgi:DNA repair ATPase RecN
LAADLTARRAAAARKLEKKVEAELAGLAMAGTVFRVAINPAPWSANGADRVDFLVSPNPGEEPRALEKVASGGEISRIALALKTCLAAPRNGPPRTLVFDEVDAGVGGSAAEGVGRRLKKLAANNQVLCVTHLPQIASFADHHYLVEKRESKGRTEATVEELDGPARTREVGRMLSGQKLTPGSAQTRGAVDQNERVILELEGNRHAGMLFVVIRRLFVGRLVRRVGIDEHRAHVERCVRSLRPRPRLLARAEHAFVKISLFLRHRKRVSLHFS